ASRAVSLTVVVTPDIRHRLLLPRLPYAAAVPTHGETRSDWRTQGCPTLSRTAVTWDATGSDPCQNTAQQCTDSHGANAALPLQPTRTNTRDHGMPTLRRTHNSEDARFVPTALGVAPPA